MWAACLARALVRRTAGVATPQALPRAGAALVGAATGRTLPSVDRCACSPFARSLMTATTGVRSTTAPALLLPPVAVALHLGGVAGLASKAKKKQRGGGGGGHAAAEPSTSSSSSSAATPTGEFDLGPVTSMMTRAVDHLRSELAGLRTGRASPGMLDHLPVPGAYGDDSGGGGHAPPLRALAATTARDAHTLVVTPFDPSTLPALEAALRDGPLSLQPQRSSGGELVVPVPPPTKDAAAAMLKVGRAAAEAARAAVRGARRTGMEAAKAAFAGEDDRRAAEKKVQQATDKHIAAVDEALAAKEKALAEV